MRLDGLRSTMRRVVARCLERLPWTCEALLAAWEIRGGWALLSDALHPRWRRICMADAARNGACYCGRYAVMEGYRHVYRATDVERSSLEGVLEAWEREEGLA